MSNQYNFTYKDLDIISMSLYDNAITGHISFPEYNLLWDLLERLYEPITLSYAEVRLICDSLLRYSIRYQYEHTEVVECKRLYEYIRGIKI